MEGLTRLKVKRSWDSERCRIGMGSETTRKLGDPNDISNKHAGCKGALQVQERKYEVTEVTVIEKKKK